MSVPGEGLRYLARKRRFSKLNLGRGVFGNYQEYTAADMSEAIELVHGGMSVIDASIRFGIPRATLFNRSRKGCKTHSGRCSTVFARTHHSLKARSRSNCQYSPGAIEKAIQLVHEGMGVIDAANLFNIPRATLFARSGKGCPTHKGRCSTVISSRQASLLS